MGGVQGNVSKELKGNNRVDQAQNYKSEGGRKNKSQGVSER